MAATLAFVPALACGATTGAPTTDAAATPMPARAVPPQGTVLVTGAVKQPFEVTIDQLHQMPRHTVEVEFHNDHGSEHHTEVGVPLAQLTPPARWPPTTRKATCYPLPYSPWPPTDTQQQVSYGEISPAFANRDVLVAVTEDGKPLNRPRLIVPGDIKGGRDVTNLIELHVSHLTPA